METVVIDGCRIQEIGIQESSPAIRLTSPSIPFVKFHLHFSGDYEAGVTGDVASSGITQATVPGGISVDSRLCAIRLRGSCEVNSRHYDRPNVSHRTGQPTAAQMGSRKLSIKTSTIPDV